MGEKQKMQILLSQALLEKIFC